MITNQTQRWSNEKDQAIDIKNGAISGELKGKWENYDGVLGIKFVVVYHLVSPLIAN